MTYPIRFNEKQQRAATLLQEALSGDKSAQNRLIEGISTSDLPVQLAPALSAIAFNNYQDRTKIWTEWASRETFDDFRPTEYMNFAWDHTDPDVEPTTAGYTHYDGGLPVVPEYGEYPVIRFEASGQSLKIHKSGIQIQFSWESIVNNRDFSILRRVPAEFGRRASVQEDVEATRPLLSAANFSVANNNLATGAEWALSYDSLKAAREFIGNQTYNGSQVTPAARYKLLVPTALVPTAEAIKQLQSREVVTVNGDVTTRDVYGNEVAGWFDIVENPYLTGLGGQADQWYLIPTPGSTPNPNVINGFLAGQETPKIFVKSTTTSNPEDGDFTDDSYSTKTRHVVTGGFIRPEGTFKADPTP